MSERDIDQGFFTAEDFGCMLKNCSERHAATANAILREWLKEQPEVGGTGYNDGELLPDEWEQAPCEPTHTARLVAVKELPPTDNEINKAAKCL